MMHQLEKNDVLGSICFLSDPDKPFKACFRLVWRKMAGGVFEAIGQIFTVETDKGVLSIHRDALGALDEAQTCNNAPAQQINPELLIEVGERHPETSGQLIKCVASEARYFAEQHERIAVGQPLRAPSLGSKFSSPSVGDTNPNKAPKSKPESKPK